MNLNQLYNDNTTLETSQTYNIVNNIVINENSFFQIPSNVTILFKGNYTITIKGNLNVGCNQYDTINEQNIGALILNENQFQRQGQIVVDTTGSATFCNTRFDGLYYGISLQTSNQVKVNKCEFNNNQVSILYNEGYATPPHMITDSIFNNVYYAINDAQDMIIENNLFKNIEKRAIGNAAKVYNNSFTGHNMKSTALYIAIGSNVEIANNTFTNWEYAIVSNGRAATIHYNEFTMNNIAINIETDEVQNINYNNFIDNMVSIQLTNAEYQMYCNHNYFGINSTDQSIISPQIIDICDGQSGGGLLMWWPWYTEPINFNALPILPTESTLDTLECVGTNNHPEINGTKLNLLYTNNVTLNVSDSPYYITNDVYVNVDVVMIIEPSVTLIFVDDYNLTIKGKIIMGCNILDTFNDKYRGLSSALSVINVTNINNETRKGRIKIDKTGSGSFCNTRFDGLYYALYLTAKQLKVDNCEFNNNQISIFYNGYDQPFVNTPHMITDNIFNDVYYGINYAAQHMIIENNLFKNIENTAIDIGCCLVEIKVYNNSFIGHNITSTAVYTGYQTKKNPDIANNTFTNWQYAISTYGPATIHYNEFTMNNIAVNIQHYDVQNINYNNFIDNNVSVKLDDHQNQENCNYNYFGINSTNQITISTQIIDVCDSEERGLIIWWPWFTEKIEFESESASLAKQATIDRLICPGPDLHPEITGTKLNLLYTNNVTLNVSDSPYYVVNNLYVNAGISMNIEKSVTLIFTDDYIINIRGILNVGCNGFHSSNTRGISSGNEFVNIYNLNNLTKARNGKIVIDKTGSAKFCNTRFDGLYYGILLKTSNQVKVDKCEFNNNQVSILYNGWYVNPPHMITNSIFNNVYYGIESANDMIIQNNLFKNIETAAIGIGCCGNGVKVYNNSFMGHNMTSSAIDVFSDNVDIANNTFTNWQYAILSEYGRAVTIHYNEFMMNSIAVNIKSDYVQNIHINYNNFIDNSMNIVLQNNYNQDYCNYNWNGAVDDITDPNSVALKISDFCDSNGYTGIITFWPYFVGPLDFNDINNLPALYTFDFEDCTGYDHGLNTTTITTTTRPTTNAETTTTTVSTDYPTTAPTNLPTAGPTTVSTETTNLPTAAPTNIPTQSPTYYPTTAPTDYTTTGSDTTTATIHTVTMDAATTDQDTTNAVTITTTTGDTTTHDTASYDTTNTTQIMETGITETITTEQLETMVTNQDNEDGISFVMILLIVIGVLVLLLCLAAYAIYVFCVKYRKKTRIHLDYVQNIQMDMNVKEVLYDESDPTTALAQTNKL